MAATVDGASVKLYFRSSSKFAKIAYFPALTSTDELYLFASRTYALPIDGLHLFLQGVLLPPSQTASLQANAIVHVVRLDELRREIIAVLVKRIVGDTRSYPFEMHADTTIGKFIDNRLTEVYGRDSREIFLVHMGRQLDLNRTFRQQEVEDGSELLAVDFQPEEVPAPLNLEPKESSQEVYTVKAPIVSVSELETPEAPKDIYPTSNFAITVPAGIETSNSLNLIFDSKVRRSSSIRNIDLDPSEIIAEEDSFIDLTKRNQSYKSEHAEEQHQPSESRFSEEWRRHQEEENGEGRSELQRVDAVGKEVEFRAGDMIYSGDLNMMVENNVMGSLIKAYKEKLNNSSSHVAK